MTEIHIVAFVTGISLGVSIVVLLLVILGGRRW